jgi:hypothetical protein
MKRIFTFATLVAVLTLGLGPAFAAMDRPEVQVRGTEGPDIRAKVEPKGTEGPDVRLVGKTASKGV